MASRVMLRCRMVWSTSFRGAGRAGAPSRRRRGGENGREAPPHRGADVAAQKMSRIFTSLYAASLLLNGCVMGGPPTRRNGALALGQELARP